ncbi:odorant receptor 67d-like [Episyrphus balteatus]|uniref:odorant receptor 67d-like n=1 Tax=Episyrphus balteatus TaxID=286459 RepID=UPI0024860408|nr:odorant receptor 67d-like [Episyrphus balteatus]
MRPSEEFSKVIRVGRICSAVCGADVFDPKYKFNNVTRAVVFCIVVYFIFSVYTVQLKISENWTVALEAFCMVGSVLQGISKLVSGIAYKNKYQEAQKFLDSIYLKYEEKGDDYVKALEKCISRTRVVLKSVALLYFFVVASLISVPIAIWIFTGKRLLVMQFYLPYLDTKTTHGYLATIGMQSTCLVFGAFGNFAGDLFLLVYFGHANVLVDIFVLKGKELSEMATDFGSPKVQYKLNEVIKWHQTYSSFIAKIDSIYYWSNFTQITTSGLSIVLTLVIMFVGDWPGAYSYLTISFVMLYLYCGMGTLVEIANDRILNEIYEIHWYILTVPQQKCIRYMLMKAQSPIEITVGGVAPLSVNTGLQVTKTVYSVFMMLLNFFDE